MLAYLEELCTALLAHDAIAIHRLLAHPLAEGLPRQVREEAVAISRANPASLRAPIQTLRFYHQTLQLGEDDPAAPASGSEPPDADDANRASGGRASPDRSGRDPGRPSSSRREPVGDPAPHPIDSSAPADGRDIELDQIELFDLASTAVAA